MATPYISATDRRARALREQYLDDRAKITLAESRDTQRRGEAERRLGLDEASRRDTLRREGMASSERMNTERYVTGPARQESIRSEGLRDVAGINASSARDVAGINAAGDRDVAGINAGATTRAAEIRNQGLADVARINNENEPFQIIPEGGAAIDPKTREVTRNPATPKGAAPDPLGTPDPASGQEQMVRVKRPDGQTGTIPISQLEAAKANGWTVL